MGVFHVLNCTNGTKSHNAPQISILTEELQCFREFWVCAVPIIWNSSMKIQILSIYLKLPIFKSIFLNLYRPTRHSAGTYLYEEAQILQ